MTLLAAQHSVLEVRTPTFPKYIWLYISYPTYSTFPKYIWLYISYPTYSIEVDKLRRTPAGRSNLSISPGLPCKKYCFCRTRPYSMFNTDLNSARREVFKSGLLFENGRVFQKLFPKNDFSEISEKSGYLTNWAVPELVGLYVRYVKIMFCTRV